MECLQVVYSITPKKYNATHRQELAVSCLTNFASIFLGFSQACSAVFGAFILVWWLFSLYPLDLSMNKILYPKDINSLSLALHFKKIALVAFIIRATMAATESTKRANLANA